MVRCSQCFYPYYLSDEAKGSELLECPMCGRITSVSGCGEGFWLREAERDDLAAILDLYLHLHETDVPAYSLPLLDAWDNIMQDPNYHLILGVVKGKIVSSCVCVVIPNLTRNARPYAFVENVVTHADFRGKGYASACLNYARKIAEENNCYKMMLMTGSKEESTLNFYRNAGYNSSDKTAFVQWLISGTAEIK